MDAASIGRRSVDDARRNPLFAVEPRFIDPGGRFGDAFAGKADHLGDGVAVDVEESEVAHESFVVALANHAVNEEAQGCAAAEHDSLDPHRQPGRVVVVRDGGEECLKRAVEDRWMQVISGLEREPAVELGDHLIGTCRDGPHGAEGAAVLEAAARKVGVEAVDIGVGVAAREEGFEVDSARRFVPSSVGVGCLGVYAPLAIAAARDGDFFADLDLQIVRDVTGREGHRPVEPELRDGGWLVVEHVGVAHAGEHCFDIGSARRDGLALNDVVAQPGGLGGSDSAPPRRRVGVESLAEERVFDGRGEVRVEAVVPVRFAAPGVRGESHEAEGCRAEGAPVGGMSCEVELDDGVVEGLGFVGLAGHRVEGHAGHGERLHVGLNAGCEHRMRTDFEEGAVTVDERRLQGVL